MGKRARTWVLVAASALIGDGGCGHSGPPPVETVPADDLPPLPPPSASAIGLVRQHDQELGLTTDQVAALEALDAKLDEVNGPLDEELRDLDRPAHEPHRAGQNGGGAGGASGRSYGGRMTGMGGGGRGMGGMGGGRGTGGAGSQAQGSSQQRPAPESAEAKARNEERSRRATALRQQISANQSTYLQQALQLLDDAQRPRAVELLDKHGYRTAPPAATQ
jgi:hypothetical protein